MRMMCFAIVRPLGFEPRTCGLRVRCSAVELEAHFVQQCRRCRGRATDTALEWKQSGVTDGARTRDPQDHNLMLYQLSYGHHGNS